MIEALITLVIYAIVIGLICFLLLWLVDSIPLPEPFRTVARAAIMIIAVLIVILLLLQLVGGGGSIRLPKLN
jgi:hypothetical protein